VVNFKNTIIIMTSNIGSHIIQENFENLKEKDVEAVVEKTQREVMDLLAQNVRPEFLNRVDETDHVPTAEPADVREIVKLQLHMLDAKLEEKDIHLIPSEELIATSRTIGFDPQFGARPIKRMIQKELLNELSRRSSRVAGDRQRPQVIDVFDGKIVFRKPWKKKRSWMARRSASGRRRRPNEVLMVSQEERFRLMSGRTSMDWFTAGGV
jgi:ATP-dependent Clp protease ATP-binding subunit ClpB